jgi:urocanate hydratase
VEHVTTDLHTAFRMALSAAERHESCSVAYHGNVVDLLEYAVQEDIPIELLSDQTSVTLFTKVGIVLPELLSKNVPGCCMNLPKRFVSW